MHSSYFYLIITPQEMNTVWPTWKNIDTYFLIHQKRKKNRTAYMTPMDLIQDNLLYCDIAISKTLFVNL